MNLIKQISWRRISQSEKRNSVAAEKNWNWKARAGKNSFPSTPFIFARPSDWILKFGIWIYVLDPPRLKNDFKFFFSSKFF